MRVAFLSKNAQGQNAVGNQIAEKARFFLERGAEVRVFVEDARLLHADLRALSVEVARPDLSGPVWDFLRQADLVFAVYAQHHVLLQYLPCLSELGVRIVLDYLSVTPPQYAHAHQREALQASLRQRACVWCADHALTMNQYTRGELFSATGFPEAFTESLPLPIDVERFTPVPGERFLHRRLGIDGHILLFVGRIAVNKRVPLLIEALARLPETTHAVVIGDLGDVYAEEVSRSLELARELKVAERVHFLGPLDDTDLPRAYRSADVLVMPSVHEGFCVPVLEAMASGVPVVASRSAALPETIGAAGLTCVPDDVTDLAQQLCRVLEDRPTPVREGILRVAFVCFRFGSDIVGGAETSLRSMASALDSAGHAVEVFTTCTRSESNWQNELLKGSAVVDGIAIHRFPIDPHDAVAHGKIVRAILDAEGRVCAEVERRYLAHSIHSAELLAELRERSREFDAIVTGPYLFGLSADILAAFPRQALLVPCFHDEPLARLALWPQLAGNAGGILYHSATEQDHGQRSLGVNHPNAHVIGACLSFGSAPASTRFESSRPYVVYCGRYSNQKNVPLLLDWMRRYQAERPDRVDLVFMGQGEVALPRETWLHDVGRVDEAAKRATLAGARALIQLSTHESLSLVTLEAWAEQTPVIAHAACEVLAGHIERSGGGHCVAEYAAFAAALDDLLVNQQHWRERGVRGRAFVEAEYASPGRFVQRLERAIREMHRPIAEQMRERGIARAGTLARERWQWQFAEFVDHVLTQPARERNNRLIVEPLQETCQIGVGTRSLLLPIRIRNAGTRAAIAEGPGRAVVCAEVQSAATHEPILPRVQSGLPALLTPGQSQIGAVPVHLPAESGEFRVVIWIECASDLARWVVAPAVVCVRIGPTSESVSGCAEVFLDIVRRTLPNTHDLQQLPSDYVDVTEGRLAPVKRLIKRKLLHNFKNAYVDVLSRQQSTVNGQVVLMLQQLTECCAILDHAITGLQQRLDGLEAKIEQWSADDIRRGTVDSAITDE